MVVAFADAQGRLVGKRVSARFFQEEVLPHGAEACNYLLSVDVDMNTVDGYAMSSWETGYGDMMLLPDAGDAPAHPVASRARALVMADLAWESGDPVVQSPRDILNRTARPPRRPRARSPTRAPNWSSSSSTTRIGMPGPAATATSRRRPTTTSTTTCSPRAGSSRCCATSG